MASFLSHIRPGLFHMVIHVKPGARSSSLVGPVLRTDTAVEVRVGAPPTDGRANREVVDFLQTSLEEAWREERRASLPPPESLERHEDTEDLAPSVRVRLIRGGTSRTKCLAIDFPGTPEHLEALLLRAAAGPPP